jgi:diaminopimelate decarboxylase
MELDWPFENIDGELFIEGASSKKLVKRFGTPLYVYSDSKIRYNINKLRVSLQKYYSKTRILYACKANTNLSILRLLHDEGLEIDAVSPGEVYLSLKAGFKPKEILFTGTSVSEDEMDYLLHTGVKMNIDSLSQLRKLIKIKTPNSLSIRLNPEVGAGHHEHVITAGPDVKFGVWEGQSVEAFKLALDAGVSEFGIQMHIGSGIMDVDNYIRAVERLLSISKHVKDSTGIKFEFIDLGGGIGVPYRPEEAQIDLDIFFGKLFQFVLGKLEDYELGLPEIWLEPGRYIVAESGILLSNVNTIKHSPNKVFVGIDAGFNTLIRPAMYGSYHHILNATGLNNQDMKYDVYGPLCESGDIFARERYISEINEGDTLAIMTTGAYGYSMSSNYNSRLRSAEVMISSGESHLIREREKLEDLLHVQPSSLK